MKNDVVFSVLVAVYNVEKYLSQCLDSLISQTFSRAEFILVDDGSTDASGQICDKYSVRDSRIKVIHKQKNEGTLLCRKTGIEVAKGKWILFVDGDDYFFSPLTLEKLFSCVDQENVDIFQFDADIVGGSKEFREMFSRILRKNDGIEKFDGAFDITKQSFCNRLFSWNLWNKTYKSEVIKKAFIHIEETHFPFLEDIYLFFLFAYFSESLKIGQTDPFYCYRLGSGISTTGMTIEKFSHLAKSILLVNWLEKFLMSENRLKQYQLQMTAIKEMITEWTLTAFNGLASEDRVTGFSLLAKNYDADVLSNLFKEEIDRKNRELEELGNEIRFYKENLHCYEQREIERHKKLHRRIRLWFKRQRQKFMK